MDPRYTIASESARRLLKEESRGCRKETVARAHQLLTPSFIKRVAGRKDVRSLMDVVTVAYSKAAKEYYDKNPPKRDRYGFTVLG